MEEIKQQPKVIVHYHDNYGTVESRVSDDIDPPIIKILLEVSGALIGIALMFAIVYAANGGACTQPGRWCEISTFTAWAALVSFACGVGCFVILVIANNRLSKKCGVNIYINNHLQDTYAYTGDYDIDALCVKELIDKSIANLKEEIAQYEKERIANIVKEEEKQKACCRAHSEVMSRVENRKV